MAKIKFDVSGVEDRPDFDKPIPRGTYRCKITDITSGESKSSGNPMLTVEYEVSERGDHKGRKLWDYIVLNDASAWKLKQLTTALGLKAKGTLDTDAALGERVLVRVKHETDDRDPDNIVVRSRVGSVNPLPEVDDDEEEEEDEEQEDDDDEGTTDDLTVDDLAEMDLDELKELIDEEELDIRVTKRSKAEAIRAKVAEALGLEEEEEEEDEDDEDGDEEEADYESMSAPELRTELKARGLPTKGRKAVLVERLEEDDQDGDEPF